MINYKIGDKIVDLLTKTVTTIVSVHPTGSNNGYVIDNDYLDGLRYNYEIEPVPCAHVKTVWVVGLLEDYERCNDCNLEMPARYR